MSLADLPDVLIAHLCFYLEYPDICNLMETSKKNYNAIKTYKKDKLNLDNMSVYIEESFVTGNVISNGKNSKKRYTFKDGIQNNGGVDYVSQIIDECFSIKSVNCDNINDDFCKAIIRTETSVGSVINICGTITATPDNFISLCEKINYVYLLHPSMNKDIFDDNVFIKCFPSMELIFKTTQPHMSLKLSDLTLEALSEYKDGSIQLNGVSTSFTVKGIVEAIQIMRTVGTRNVDWNVGTLLPGQFKDAECYFNKENGELKNQYDISVYEGCCSTFYKTMLNRNIKSLYWNLGVLLHGQQDVVDRYFNSRNGELRNQFKIEVEDDDYYHITDYQLTIAHEEVRAICISFEVSQR